MSRAAKKPWERSWAVLDREWDAFGEGAQMTRTPENLDQLLDTKEWRGSSVTYTETDHAVLAVVKHRSGAEARILVRWKVSLHEEIEQSRRVA